MFLATQAVLYAGAAGYIGAAFLALCYLRGGRMPCLENARRAAMAGVLLLAATVALRFITWRLLPMTSGSDSMVLFALMGTVIALVTSTKPDRRALMCFYWPPLAFIVCLSLYMAGEDFAHSPKPFPTVLLGVHVSLAMLSYAMFLIASLTSLAYVFQAARLKKRQTSGLFQRLPALEQLDHTLFALIKYGYPFFVVTLWLGLFWAWYDNDSLSNTWWLSPKIVLSLVMAALYAVTFHVRRRGMLRGPKLAYFVVLGFGLVLAVYLVLNVLNLINYNFWSPAA